MSEVSIIHKLDISSAPLPVAYEKAKMAISECNNIDECKDWSDKAQALASYARQAGDDELEQMSKRIRARATRRCGELLKVFDGKGNNQHSSDEPTKLQAGIEAGLSKDQQVTANRLSNIPEDQFNNQIESNNIPTLTQLSEQGKKKTDYLYQPKPEGFAKAIHFRGALDYLIEYCEKYEPDFLLGGMTNNEKNESVKKIQYLESWFDKFIVKI